MKSGVHPENYRLVAFKDMSNDDVFITKSTANSKEKIDDNKDIWEKNKKNVNIYEFIYTSSNNINNIEGDVYYFDQGQYNIKSGKATYTTKKIPFVLDKMQKLHKATTNSPIYWLNIFFGLSLLFFVISAFWMFMPSTTVFKRGIYFSILGFIMTIIVLFL